MLIRIRRSKDLLLQFQSFECSLFASNSCVYCTTRYSKCGRIGTKWLFFFTFIEKCCVVIEKNIDKKLANRISHQIWYKRCLKGKFGRGGPYPLADLDRGIQIRGGPNPTSVSGSLQVTSNAFFTTTQGNDLRYATTVFSITIPKTPTSERFKWTANLLVSM